MSSLKKDLNIRTSVQIYADTTFPIEISLVYKSTQKKKKKANNFHKIIAAWSLDFQHTGTESLCYTHTCIKAKQKVTFTKNDILIIWEINRFSKSLSGVYELWGFKACTFFFHWNNFQENLRSILDGQANTKRKKSCSNYCNVPQMT